MNEGLIEGGHCLQVGDCVTVGGSGAFGKPSWAAQILNISGLASRGLLSEFRSAMSQLSCSSAAALSDSWVMRSGVCADLSAGMLQGACCLC